MTRERPILLGFVVQRKGIDGRERSLSDGGAALDLSLLALLGWFALAGRFIFTSNTIKNSIKSYTKMLTLLPFGLETHRVEMGNYHIERGLSEIKEGITETACDSCLGVARSPANLKGRRVLAEFYEFALNDMILL